MNLVDCILAIKCKFKAEVVLKDELHSVMNKFIVVDYEKLGFRYLVDCLLLIDERLKLKELRHGFLMLLIFFLLISK